MFSIVLQQVELELTLYQITNIIKTKIKYSRKSFYKLAITFIIDKLISPSAYISRFFDKILIYFKFFNIILQSIKE